ncbi:MAG: MATE family efflux transporter, partial [Bacteroidetes bacterium SW_10_40_5]
MNKEILRLAIPNIVSNLTVPLLGSVDTALMGHLDNEAHLGAIALGTMIFNFIYWGFGFLRMGTTGLTAQAYGDQHESELINLLGRAVFAALSISVLLMLLQTPIIWMAFKVISATEEVEAFTRDYFRV